MLLSRTLLNSALKSFKKSIYKLEKVCDFNSTEMSKNNDQVARLNGNTVELQKMTDQATRIKTKLEELLA